MLFNSTSRPNICERLDFLSFAENMSKNIGKNVNKNVRKKVPKKVCNVSRTSLQNNSEAITNQMENRKEIIDDLSLIY